MGEVCECYEEKEDGILDLSLNFKTQEVVTALLLDDLAAGDLPELVVSGNLLDGTAFDGSDCVRLVPPGTATERDQRAGQRNGGVDRCGPAG